MSRGSIVLAAVAVMVAAFVAALPGRAQVVGTYYTAHNIWFENPQRMYSTNYQKGAMIRAGTPVLALQKTSRDARFTDGTTGIAHRIQFVARHHPGVTAEAVWTRMFTTQPRPALVAGLSPGEIQAIDAGTVVQGMTKRAVLVAVGYPPESRTPSIMMSQWRYWRSRTNSYLVNFVGESVGSITE